ncbi:uncharacterized protein KD926_004991 [Aspergillus affinis]|uniref:uncharacterized protein n=1 Tax=Aspergillus affinis TaxID=1070780 RepID=UPI0022FEE83E|nr:uncharacterized protein KD926_004991 [Aspergillus affinis]KAI9034943.1 hypothetical protein KD926_004991 [Aspergillus affinis]
MSFDRVQQWLVHAESVRASQSDSRDDDRPKHMETLTPPSTSVPYVKPTVKRKHESQLPAMEAPKRQRRGAKGSEINAVTSASIFPLRDDLTLSPSASATSQSQSRQRSPSPARHKRLLEYATPKIRYLSE